MHRLFIALKASPSSILAEVVRCVRPSERMDTVYSVCPCSMVRMASISGVFLNWCDTWAQMV
ncbi:MAG: hypothetical protein IKJ90_00800 [Bacteroidaceae bacterium]|nr:hypothetical protein [Bacteroidaceae bacterium]